MAGAVRGWLREVFAGPLVQRELAGMRSRRTVIQALMTMLTAGLLFDLAPWTLHLLENSFNVAALLALNAGLILGALRGALLLSRERDGRTLDLLLVSPMTETSIVAQAVVAVTFRTAVVVSGPFLLLMASRVQLGDASFYELAVAALLVVAATAVGTAVGVAASVGTGRSEVALVAALAIAISWAWLPAPLMGRPLNGYRPVPVLCGMLCGPGPREMPAPAAPAPALQLYLASTPDVALTASLPAGFFAANWDGVAQSCDAGVLRHLGGDNYSSDYRCVVAPETGLGVFRGVPSSTGPYTERDSFRHSPLAVVPPPTNLWVPNIRDSAGPPDWMPPGWPAPLRIWEVQVMGDVLLVALLLAAGGAALRFRRA